jgi:hypothetical protein
LLGKGLKKFFEFVDFGLKMVREVLKGTWTVGRFIF